MVIEPQELLLNCLWPASIRNYDVFIICSSLRFIIVRRKLSMSQDGWAFCLSKEACQDLVNEKQNEFLISSGLLGGLDGAEYCASYHLMQSSRFSPVRLRPTTTCLWRLQMRGPCLAWLCSWGPWGSGCVATAPGSWPSTTGPPPACCTGSAPALMPAAQDPMRGAPSRMSLAELLPARTSHHPPSWGRNSPETCNSIVNIA